MPIPAMMMKNGQPIWSSRNSSNWAAKSTRPMRTRIAPIASVGGSDRVRVGSGGLESVMPRSISSPGRA